MLFLWPPSPHFFLSCDKQPNSYTLLVSSHNKDAASQAWERILAPLLTSGEIMDKSLRLSEPGLSVNRDNDPLGLPGGLS